MEQRSTLQCHVELTGVLARHIPTRLVEISRSGCLLESGHRIDEGTVGALRIEVQGRAFSEDVRATRCVAVAGMGSRYLIGIEFLNTGRTDGTSIRRAMLSALIDSTSVIPGSWST
jgi:hypothetical protein